MVNMKERTKMSHVLINIFSTSICDKILRGTKLCDPMMEKSLNCIFDINVRSWVSNDEMTKCVNNNKNIGVVLRRWGNRTFSVHRNPVIKVSSVFIKGKGRRNVLGFNWKMLVCLAVNTVMDEN